MRKTEFRIRPATAKDAANLAALSIAVWIDTYAKEGIRDSYSAYISKEFTQAKLEEIIAQKDTRIWIAESRSSLVGYLQLSTASLCPEQTGCRTEIERLYILNRFSRQGIGRSLLNKSMEFCSNINRSSLWLATNTENIPAIKFYTNAGFSIIGSIMFELEDGEHLNHVFLRNL